MEFTSTIERFDSDLWVYHVVVLQTMGAAFTEGKDRRVVCCLNDEIEFQCALMPRGDGHFFININKEIRTKLNLKLGSSVKVSLRRDDSEYGLPMPEELEEALALDEEGKAYFDALTPGKKRTLLHLVSSVKKSDIRIEKALIILEHLKDVRGKLDFKRLNEAFKKN